MAYIKDVMNTMKCKYDEAIGANIRLIIGKGAVAEGFSKLVSCSTEEVVLKFSSKIIKICGKNLRLASVNCCELTVLGDITFIGDDSL